MCWLRKWSRNFEKMLVCWINVHKRFEGMVFFLHTKKSWLIEIFSQKEKLRRKTRNWGFQRDWVEALVTYDFHTFSDGARTNNDSLIVLNLKQKENNLAGQISVTIPSWLAVEVSLSQRGRLPWRLIFENGRV